MKKITIEDLFEINVQDFVNVITEFISTHVNKARAQGVVIGLSGGVDSSTAAFLAVNALGKERVYGLIMPDRRTTPEDDIEDAIEVAKLLDIRYSVIDITRIYDAYVNSIPFFSNTHKIACGNLRARIRMNILYYYANSNNFLVLGSGDRSELLIGYYTKYGDGAVDLLPLGCLYKTQVRYIGKHLGLPEKIYKKPSSPRLWPGHMAEEELGMSYTEIDLVLYSLFDKGLSPEEASKATGVHISKVMKILEMHKKTRHKRMVPPVPNLPDGRYPLKELDRL